VEGVRRQVQEDDLAIGCHMGIAVLDLGDGEAGLAQERGGTDAGWAVWRDLRARCDRAARRTGPALRPTVATCWPRRDATASRACASATPPRISGACCAA
jgi:hypothetical protein